jgi:hypothetical protein
MTLFFLDFEASSLLPGSFPIEVAWVAEDGTSESHLIRPADHWLDAARGHPGWSPESEMIHGISLESLMREGEPVEVVARRTEDVLTRLTALVCSDSPPSDGYWLQRLLEAGNMRREVPIVDIYTVYGWSCRALLHLLPPIDHPDRSRGEQRVSNLSREIVGRAEEAEHVAQRIRHRALPDALSLWRTQQAIKAEVRRQLQEAGR